MARRVRTPFRLEIVGLNPRLFDICVRNAQALVESKTKGNHEVSGRASDSPQSSPELQNVPPEVLAVYNKIASIVIDFQRAYGRTVEFRIFERSKNKVAEYLLRNRGQPPGFVPQFFVNGVRVFRGLPQSFSELDEAIDKAFGRGA